MKSQIMLSLTTPIEKIQRIGPAYIKRLHKLDIRVIGDFFYHFPHRYEDFAQNIPINQLKLNEPATIQGEIQTIKNTTAWQRRITITEALIKDQSGSIKAIWFNQPYLLEALPPKTAANFSGKLVQDKRGLYLSNPTYEFRGQASNFIHTGRLVPIYPETAGLSSRWLRYITRPLFPLLSQTKDFLPYQIRKNQKLLDLSHALKQIHFPDNWPTQKAAQKRLSFDELFLIQMSVLNQRKKWRENSAFIIPFNQELIQNFVKKLSFKLTNAQRRTTWEILQDLEKKQPMNRLLEGDVGSGKTVVAALAALETAQARYQTALMAPTEVLAQQHFKEITKLLKNFNLSIGLLTGQEAKIKTNETQLLSGSQLRKKISTGEVDILIGTHALIQERIKFKNLALAIIDEQHRFGVQQRAALQQNIIKLSRFQEVPHLLSMTATPIPRTLALTIYGDLDISLLDELPAERRPIITKLIAPQERPKVYQFIESEIKKGRQAFVVCPRIEINQIETSQEIKAVKKEYEKLSLEIFPQLSISMLHGKLKTKEKEKIMQDFKNKKSDILVSTSVIEVGIDMPNANIMVIEGAERFGLSQLHQFRGRVGRGADQSYCFLSTENKTKKNDRLKALLDSKTGFDLAEKDLAIRGPGEIYGLRQWGAPDLAISSFTDIKFVQIVRQEAANLLKQDPDLKKYPLLKKRLREFHIIRHFE